jgi:heme/copper-type cytochrome/quinol oxidase subunit 2
METSILVTLFLMAIVFGAVVLALVVYTVKRESRAAPPNRPDVDEGDNPRPPVER